MYQIIKNWEPFALTDRPDYIKLSKNGCYVPATAKDAQGVALNSVPYNLLGREPMPGLETVILKEVDGGTVLLATREDVEQNRADIDYLAVMGGVDL